MNKTRKLSGPEKERFFKRLFVDVGGLDIPTADRLTEAASELISSIRVRKNIRFAGPARAEQPTDDAPAETAPAPDRKEPFHPEPVFTPDPGPAPQPSKSPEFDAFAFGLVPVYKREGAAGLSARLSEISSVAHLRAMAKAQQIVLAREMRSGDIDISALRAAILDAVARRVADRRAM